MKVNNIIYRKSVLIQVNLFDLFFFIHREEESIYYFLPIIYNTYDKQYTVYRQRREPKVKVDFH